MKRLKGWLVSNRTAPGGIRNKAPRPGKEDLRPGEIEGQYRTLFERLPIGLYRSTPDGLILDANPAMVKLLGYPSREALLSVTAQVLFVNPEDRRREQALLEESHVLMSAELQLRQYGGMPIWVKDTVQLVRDAHHGMIYEGSLEDITELKKAEAERSFLASIVESSGDAIIGEALDGTILSWNGAAERIFGYSAQEMRGRSVAVLFPPEKSDDLAASLEKVQGGERVENFETRRITKDGRLIDISLTLSPIRDPAGQVVGISKIVRDITRRKQMEKYLLQTERHAAMGRLSAGLAHEIKNPLQAIQSNLELAMDYPLESDERLECLKICRNEVDRLTDITQEMLSFARTEHYTVHPISIPSIWEQAAGLLRLTLEKKAVQVTTDFPPDLPQAFGVADQLIQVLLNLALNSLEAMPGGGELDVKAEAQGDQVWITLTNNGPPISEEDLERVFEPFFTTKPEGAGLGLFICQNIIQKHGGTLSVENLEERNGVRYTICLQAAPQDSLSKVENRSER